MDNDKTPATQRPPDPTQPKLGPGGFQRGYVYPKKPCELCGELISENAMARHKKGCEQASPELRLKRKTAREKERTEEQRQRDRDRLKEIAEAKAAARAKANAYSKERYWRLKQQAAGGDSPPAMTMANGAVWVEPPKTGRPLGSKNKHPYHRRASGAVVAAGSNKIMVTLAIDFDMLRTLLTQLGATSGISIENIKLV